VLPVLGDEPRAALFRYRLIVIGEEGTNLLCPAHNPPAFCSNSTMSLLHKAGGAQG